LAADFGSFVDVVTGAICLDLERKNSRIFPQPFPIQPAVNAAAGLPELGGLFAVKPY